MAPATAASANEEDASECRPLISGSPALSVKDVQGWFRDAFGVDPSEADVFPIASGLNQCRLFESQWGGSPEFTKARRANPSRLRMQRIGEALRALQTDLHAYLKDSREIRPNDKNTDLKALIKAVDRVVPGFQKFPRPLRGREPLHWHSIARNLKPLIRSALQSSGVQRVGFGKPTSPSLKIIQSALRYLGVDKSVDNIFDALRGRKKKGKLSR